MRILVASDGSQAALHAALWAVRNFGRDQHYTIVCAHPTMVAAGLDASGFAGPVLSAEEVEMRDRASEVAADAAVSDTAEHMGSFPVEQRTIVGSPGHAICDVATEIGADLVVIGAHNRNVLARALLGSVSSHVARHAPCPVLIVREHVPADAAVE